MDTAAAQRARARLQYSNLARFKATPGTASLRKYRKLSYLTASMQPYHLLATKSHLVVALIKSYAYKPKPIITTCLHKINIYFLPACTVLSPLHQRDKWRNKVICQFSFILHFRIQNRFIYEFINTTINCSSNKEGCGNSTATGFA